MLAQLLVAGLLLQATTTPQAAKPATREAGPSTAKDSDTDPPALLKVKHLR